jgi:hypothetical protein
LAETGAIVDYLLARYGGGNIVVAPQAPNFADICIGCTSATVSSSRLR